MLCELVFKCEANDVSGPLTVVVVRVRYQGGGHLFAVSSLRKYHYLMYM